MVMNRCALSLCLSVVTASSSAVAQPAPASPPNSTARTLSASLTGAAKAAFALSLVLLDNGDFAGAYAALGRAYDLSKNPRLLFNMAICARDMHDYARMRSLLVRYEIEGAATIADDERLQVNDALVALRQRVGAVDLTVSVAGATVTVDGATVGTTPLGEPIVLNPGRHTLTVSKTGLRPSEQIVDIAAGSETPVSVNLLAQPDIHAQHLVIASDESATVIVDGKEVARGRFDGALAPGLHDVSVIEPGKVAYEAQIDLQKGETRVLQVTLQGEQRGNGWWPWIAGSAAVTAGLAVGGYFLFRPHDRQALPSSLGAVQLTIRRP